MPTPIVRKTRAQQLRNNYIRGKYPRQRSDGTWTFSSGPSSPGTLTPEPRSPRGFSPEFETPNSPRSPRSPRSSQPEWMVPAAGLATVGMMYSTRRRYPHKKRAPRHNSSVPMMSYVSPPASLPTSTTLTYDPAQGRLVGKDSQFAYSTPGTAGGSIALLVGTFAAATLAARKRKARAQKKK